MTSDGYISTVTMPGPALAGPKLSSTAVLAATLVCRICWSVAKPLGAGSAQGSTAVASKTATLSLSSTPVFSPASTAGRMRGAGAGAGAAAENAAAVGASMAPLASSVLRFWNAITASRVEGPKKRRLSSCGATARPCCASVWCSRATASPISPTCSLAVGMAGSRPGVRVARA